MLRAHRHRAGHRDPGRQIAILQEVVLGEPHEVQAQRIEPGHLVDDRGIQAGHVHARGRRVAEVIDSANTKRWTHARDLRVQWTFSR